MTAPSEAGEPGHVVDAALQALLPVVRRVVAARVQDANLVEDLVQETVVRVLSASHRVEPGMLQPYAIATARNVVTSMWQNRDRQRRNQHRVVDLRSPELPDETVLLNEERSAVGTAMERLSERERVALTAHVIAGQDVKSLARELGGSPGALATQLNRARARLRVEYLLALENVEPPTARCRPVLLALSGADRRRQREVDAAQHLLECELCSRLSGPLLDRGRESEVDARIPVRVDADVVAARQGVRDVAAQAGFTATEQTMIATAVSEMARNVVSFSEAGEVVVQVVDEPRAGILIVVRDTGEGIPDVGRALADGFSTCGGLGLGLPGARRLMDEFSVVSVPGRGTTITMTKWRRS